ncbi:MAG: hypothetical protein HKN36_08240 [Hellea sp.]|nr:hypothetical protein [Hellea sp.]
MTPAEELQLRRAIDSGDMRAELALRKGIEAKAQPREDYGQPRQTPGGAFDVGGGTPISELYPSAASMFERTLQQGTAMAAEPVAGIAGLSQAINPLAPEGAGGQMVRDVREALTYQPKTDQAQTDQAAFAEMVKPVADWIDKARLGDEALDAGMPPAVAAIYESFPEMVTGMLTAAGLGAYSNRLKSLKPSSRGMTRAEIKTSLTEGADDVRAARFMLDKKGQVVDYPLATQAHKQGWSDEVITFARSAGKNPATRKKALEMIDIAKRAKKDPVWGVKNRPQMVMGDSIMTRYQYLKDLNKNVGKQINSIAKESLGGKSIDHAGIFQGFYNDIAELGGTIKKGKLAFEPGSRLHGQTSNQRGLRIIQDQIKALGPTPDAYAMHKLKQNIDDFVQFGKAGRSKNPLTGQTENVLKSLRRNINEQLKGVSSNYDSVNTIFSDTKDAINALGDAFGKSLFGKYSVSATGQKMRRWISMAESRNPIIEAYELADDVALKYGASFSDDAAPQILLSNALDDVLTTPFSRHTFASQSGRQVQQALERSTLANVATWLDEGITHFRGVDDFKAMGALEKLVQSGQ